MRFDDRRSATQRLRVIVLGYIVRGPLGGLAWHHMQYLVGLTRLGHSVMFVEDSDDYACCYDPDRDIIGIDPSSGLCFAERAFGRAGLGECWVYHDAHTGRSLGPAAERFSAFARNADLLIDISGVNPLRPWMWDIPVRALIDTDPVFTQLRHLQDPAAAERAQIYTAFVSFGENIGSARSTIPSDGRRWATTRQPIVLSAWPVAPPCPDGAFTTVMLWDSYDSREHEGHRYGMKSESFGPYFDLPSRTRERLEMSVGKPTAPRELLSRSGWRVRDPLPPTRDPWTYQEYLQSSKAEFSVAKHGYVVTRSGWFSERSACYLATGRPVVTQETGFSELLPTGAGLLSFDTPDEALTAIEDVSARYNFHCQAARAVAEEHFDSDKILNRLLDTIFADARAATPSAESLPLRPAACDREPK